MNPKSQSSNAIVAALIRPPDRLKISEWAERKAWIPKKGNAEPGKYRLSRLPYQRDMLDDPLNPNATIFVWVMASQVGKTFCIILIVQYHIEHRPISMYIVYPTLDSAKKWFRKKFIPTTRETPCMDGLLKEPRSRDSESTTLDRMFPGGDITGVGANSPSALRQESKEGIVEDELDAYEMNAEGDPEELADMRASTFANAWIIKSSTPGRAGLSRVWNRFEGNEQLGIASSDKRFYFIPCPKCAAMQHLKWSQFKFSFAPDEYDRALKLFPVSESLPVSIQKKTHKNGETEIRDTRRSVIVCENSKCGHWITDKERIACIMSGDESNSPLVVDGKEYRAAWQATAPFSGVVGRHLNGFYRLMGRKKSFANYHHEFAESFLKANAGGREKLMVWTNTFLAEPFADKFDQQDWHPLMQRAEDYEIHIRDGRPEIQLPVEVMILVAAMDLHPDRVEIGVFGIGDQEEWFWIHREAVWGNFDLPEMQERVNEVLLRKWRHPVLGDIGISCAGLDVGNQTKIKAGYRFCKKHGARKIWAVKGSPIPNAAVYTDAFEKRFRVLRLNIGTDTVKQTIFDRLNTGVDISDDDQQSAFEGGARSIHFPRARIKYRVNGEDCEFVTNFDERFYRQLCSEKRERSVQRGVFTQKWVKTQPRNEALDVFVYGMAVFEKLNAIGWIARQWADVSKKLDGKIDSVDVKKQETTDYVLKSTAKPAAQPKPKEKPAWPRKPSRGGVFNPLGL